MTAQYDNADGRLRGRRLQERRLKLWSKDPHCARCRKLVEFSAEGFQLDHVVALTNGGTDNEDNCQVLCTPCHDRKTAQDMSYTPIGGDTAGNPTDPRHPWNASVR